MRKPTEIERLYVDFDSFFASVEQQEQPRLRGRPVGVIPLDSPHTSIIAASPEAKRLGVKGIMPVREARRLAPDIALVVARPDVYVRVNRRIVETVERIAPVIGVRSIDELVADVSGWSRAEGLARARRVKTEVAEAVGPWVRCSIGLASNELLAKIAAEMDKPDGLTVLAPEDLPGRLMDLKLRDLPGIAGGMARRLEAAGVIDMAGLWALAPKEARAIWRSVEGERFWAQLHGFAIEKQATSKSMYGHSRVLARDWRTSERARDCARLLLTKAARRMRREGYAASVVSLRIYSRRRDDPGVARDKQVRAATDDHTFLKCLDELWPQCWPASATVVAVSLHGLSPAGEAPADLFDTQEGNAETAKWRSISATLDSLNSRFGRSVVSIGPQVNLPGGYAGAKIAFGRIPDERDF